MTEQQVVLITGTSKGIGKYLVGHYLEMGFQVVGCSRGSSDVTHSAYRHFNLDITDESTVKQMFAELSKAYGRLDVLINNAGIAAMNHALLTPYASAQKILNTNVMGTFLFCREAAKLMMKRKYGRIVNFTTVAVPLKLDGEALYAASKAAVVTLTQILAKELASYNITANAVGPTPVRTDLIRSVPEQKLEALLEKQAIHRFGEFRDVSNVIDFYIQRESDFITGQTLFLGGV